ncbi:hypothetical protein EJB05_49204 [Eragrostis curvula]|uniref:Uncharacterized protein n=1 Tax=Eragrostis curvula TaxID=38414 RepID=A0A5J9T471_9POAL|nr:hypothetical protein EJB05_49204 [Eragrostis curvula]
MGKSSAPCSFDFKALFTNAQAAAANLAKQLSRAWAFGLGGGQLWWGTWVRDRRSAPNDFEL